MFAKTQEHRLKAAASRCGLKLLLDRFGANGIVRNRYFLRPIWDARRAVRALPGGGWELVRNSAGRRNAASLMTLDDVELLLALWSEPKPFGPHRRRERDTDLACRSPEAVVGTRNA